MSTDFVEGIHIRIRDELGRAGLSMAEAARQIQEDNSQGLRDVCAGRKRASAELVGKLTAIPGLDVLYVLTGRRSVTYQTHAQGATVTSIGATEGGGLTQLQVLAMVIDALHKLGKTLPSKAVFAVVEAVMALQRAGATVNKSAVEAQLRLVR